MAITYKQSDKSSRFLVPTGDSAIDVTKMAWTLTPQSGRVNIPCMYLTEFQQNVGQLISAAVFYSKSVANVVNGTDGLIAGTGDDRSIYKYKYFAEPTGFTYKIPFFSQKKTNKTNDFGYENDQNPFSEITKLASHRAALQSISGHPKGGGLSLLGTVGAISQAAVGIANTALPGKINLENPQSWTNSTPPTYSVTFDLYNTGTVEQIADNRNLAYILAYQNSPARRSAFIVDPPVIYDMYIPDVIAMPACYVSALEISNLGNTRQMQLYGDGVKRIIPEAYRFNLTFSSLLMDTRNIMNGLDTGDRIQAVDSLEAFVNSTDSSLLKDGLKVLNDGNTRPK